MAMGNGGNMQVDLTNLAIAFTVEETNPLGLLPALPLRVGGLETVPFR